MLLENGIYRALVKDISIYLRGDHERLTAAFRIECEGKELVHREWLELNDGTISDKTIRRLRTCFPKWDGNIESLEQGFCVQDVEVDITVENEQDKDDPAKWWTRTRHMDPPGGSAGGSAALPEKEARATIVSKYGARFRAIAGGKPAASGKSSASGTPADMPAGQGGGTKGTAGTTKSGNGSHHIKATPPAKPAPVSGSVSTLEECWDELCKKHPDEMREQVSERWFTLLGEVIPGKDQVDFDPQDWGKVMVQIGMPF